MSDVEEMFLKAADFRLIIKERDLCSAIGWSIKTRFGEWGSYFLVAGPISGLPITEQLIDDATNLFKEAALKTLLRLIGRQL